MINITIKYKKMIIFLSLYKITLLININKNLIKKQL